jgi:hypothetical protein
MIRRLLPVGNTDGAPACRSETTAHRFEPLQKTAGDHDLVIGSSGDKTRTWGEKPHSLAHISRDASAGRDMNAGHDPDDTPRRALLEGETGVAGAAIGAPAKRHAAAGQAAAQPRMALR